MQKSYKPNAPEQKDNAAKMNETKMIDKNGQLLTRNIFIVKKRIRKQQVP